MAFARTADARLFAAGRVARHTVRSPRTGEHRTLRVRALVYGGARIITYTVRPTTPTEAPSS